jgi:hypothetical protein
MCPSAHTPVPDQADAVHVGPARLALRPGSERKPQVPNSLVRLVEYPHVLEARVGVWMSESDGS